MHLRALIQGNRPISGPPTLATVATVATVRPETPQTVATVATVAALGPPESWAERLRTLAPAAGIDWRLAADALDMLLRAGVVEKALRLGWDAARADRAYAEPRRTTHPHGRA